MARKVRKYPLSQDGIDSLIKDLEAYRASIPEKCVELCRRLSDEGIKVAREAVDGTLYAAYLTFSKEVEPNGYGAKAVLVATESGRISLPYLRYGKRVSVDVSPLLMSEYGSGARAVEGWRGTFPNPNRGEEPSHGLDDRWWWMDTEKNWHMSAGTEPSREMFLAVVGMRERIVQIAREVFGGTADGEE